MRKIVTLFLTCSILLVDAQDYNAFIIAEELKEGANAVVRKDEGHFKILSIDKAEFTFHYAVTILNERADDMAYIAMGYDKLKSLSDININVYDGVGKRIKRVKANEIDDRSAYSDNLFDDNRIKYVDVKQSTYPYTVEVSYKLKYKYLYSIPNWFFCGNENVSSESSKYVLEYPIGIGARYREFNFDGKKSESESDGFKRISWEMNGMPVMDLERYGPSDREVIPNLRFAASKFSYEGYEGDLSSWDGMAKWQMSLNEGRDRLPAETVSKIRSMTDGMTPLDKIKTVYKYVQENTRYVSVQLGVGGFQPFPAEVVDEVGYGDCKALSFYTQSLLSEVGVDSYYSWVFAGNRPPEIDRDFPEDIFNHIILAVPHENDTIWLECTSQTNPFGYLGGFTGNREALMISESGGDLVRTTSYPTESNNMISNVTIEINKDGHALVERSTYYEGTMADYMLDRSVWSKDDQKDYLEEAIDIPTFELQDFSFERVNDVEVRLDVKLWVNRLLSKSGTRLFLQPNVMNKNYFVPVKYKERKTDVVVRSGFHEYDTLNFSMPAGFRVEAKFDPIDIQSEFGEYQAEIIQNEDGEFQYVRHFMQKKGRFDAAKYDDYLQFHKDVVRADKRKIALVSGT